MPKLIQMSVLCFVCVRVCVCIAEELSISISVSNSQIQENVVSVCLCLPTIFHNYNSYYSHFCLFGYGHGQVKPQENCKKQRGNLGLLFMHLTVD